MIKKSIFSLAILFALFSSVFAQSEKEEESGNGGFRKDKLFTGGNITLQFGNQVTTLGVSPYFGYSITNGSMLRPHSILIILHRGIM